MPFEEQLKQTELLVLEKSMTVKGSRETDPVGQLKGRKEELRKGENIPLGGRLT